MKIKLLFTLLWLLALIVAPNALKAQNANRNGWIVELQGARVLGTIYQTPDFNEKKEMGNPVYRKKGGVAGTLNFGYRWSTSQFCAVEAKLFVSDNFADAKRLTIGILPGFRYTTKEITGNTSVYLSANAGFGIAPIANGCYPGYFVPSELSVGLNFGPMFSLGVFFGYNICVGGETILDINNNYSQSSRLDLKSNASIGLKAGLRF